MDNSTMTGAELQCLREACGLDRDQFGEMCGLRGSKQYGAGRTIKLWETGKAHGVPADVAALVIELERKVSTEAEALLNAQDGKASVVMWHSADTLQNEAEKRVYLELRRRGRDVRMVAFDEKTYRALVEESEVSDTQPNRDEWARLAVSVQSRPYPADQPPAK